MINPRARALFDPSLSPVRPARAGGLALPALARLVVGRAPFAWLFAVANLRPFSAYDRASMRCARRVRLVQKIGHCMRELYITCSEI